MSDVKPAEVDGGGGGGGESTTATTTTQGVTSVLDDLGADSPSVQTGELLYFILQFFTYSQLFILCSCTFWKYAGTDPTKLWEVPVAKLEVISR